LTISVTRLTIALLKFFQDDQRLFPPASSRAVRMNVVRLSQNFISRTC
jgi:hypothetical protein